MPNVPLDTLKGSVSGQLKHTDRRDGTSADAER